MGFDCTRDDQRIHAYTFTINNWTEEEGCEASIQSTSGAPYICYGKEVGANGTPHLQGVIYFRNGKTMSAVSKLKGFRRAALFAKYKESTFERWANYCKKGDQTKKEWDFFHEDGPTYGENADVWELGDLPQPGKRSGFAEARDMVMAGHSVGEILVESQSYQVARGVELSMKYLEPARTRAPEVRYVTTNVGAGMRLHASRWEKYADTWLGKGWYRRKCEGKFWNFYDRHKSVVIELPENLEKTAQRWLWRDLGTSKPWYLETKGACRQMVAENILIVSEFRADHFGLSGDYVDHEESPLFGVLRIIFR